MEGFYRVAAAVPTVRVAAIEENVAEIIHLYEEAVANECALVVFPELCITGYTCADLFLQEQLLQGALTGLQDLCAATVGKQTLMLVGLPIRHHTHLYDCAAVLQDGAILGIVPKSYLPNYNEFYEKRWFSPGMEVADDEVLINECPVPFGTDLLFRYDQYFTLGIEICEDLWNVVPPSCYQALAGATVLANLSASNELVAKADYRRSLVRDQSGRCVAGYVYSSAGVGESTTDVVFGGHAMIAENSAMLAESERFLREGHIIYADLDCMRLSLTRIAETSFSSNPPDDEFVLEQVGELPTISRLNRSVDPHPFVPTDPATRDQRCREIFSIQAAGLAKRLEHAGAQTAVIGISGGLDSTLALLVASRAMEEIGRGNDAILAVTMPGFGTSDRTYENAVSLCKSMGTDFREISIKAACEQQFRDIGHDPNEHSVTYENVQARQRTQILMNLANKHNGLVIGTGDLSEMALGWCTYNGDHMSMYAVNTSVPKTLVRYVIQWVADQHEEICKTLLDILDTPITPELLPTTADGGISQETEKAIGPYELHDFFLYHSLRYGARPSRVLQLAEIAFDGTYSADVIKQWLTIFIRRFFQQQFKRSCIPDGPKVGTISLSPRGDWRMPSDAVSKTWLDDIAD